MERGAGNGLVRDGHLRVSGAVALEHGVNIAKGKFRRVAFATEVNAKNMVEIGVQKGLGKLGGAFIDPETRKRIKECAFSIWLRADFDVLLRRVSRRNNRPLLKVENKEKVLRQLIEERYPIYEEADIIVQSQDGPHEKTVSDVIAALKRLGESEQLDADAVQHPNLAT